MALTHRLRLPLLLALLAAILLAGVAAALTYGAERRLLQQAKQQGIRAEFGSLKRRLFVTTLHDVKLVFEKHPGVAVSLDEVTLRGHAFGTPAVTIGAVQLRVTGEPSAAYDSLRSPWTWEGLPFTWGKLDIRYSHRLFGEVVFENVRAEPSAPQFVATAETVRLGTLLFRDVQLSVQRQNAMLEFGLRTPDIAIEVRYFPPTARAALWMVSLRNQPLRPLAALLGWELAAPLAGTRVGGSLSFHVPDHQTAAIRGQLQLVFDDWPKPSWPDADALLGKVAAFGAILEPMHEKPGWELTRGRMNLLVFSLEGGGRLELGAKPRLALELSGARNCAQLGAHLPPSTYSRAVKSYLDGPAKSLQRQNGADPLRGEVRLRLQVELDGQTTRAPWQLQPGCGLAEQL